VCTNTGKPPAPTKVPSHERGTDFRLAHYLRTATLRATSVARKKRGGYHDVPLARYFFFVGSLLFAIIFVADWYLPDSPQTSFREGQIDKSIIRIKSAHKWPEPIVIDTSLPTIVPPPSAVMASAPPINQPREALAQIDASAQQVSKNPSPTSSKAKVAKAKKVTHTRVAAYRESPQGWASQAWAPQAWGPQAWAPQASRVVSARQVLPAGW
jgi:hypothetical protein